MYNSYRLKHLISCLLSCLLVCALLLNSCNPDKPPAPAQHALSFNSNGGSAVDVQTIQNGSKAIAPADPTKSGYTFVGWYTDQALQNAFDFTTTITANITLYAKWEQVVQHTLSFNSNGGSAVDAQTIQNGSKATAPANPTKSGYAFAGWYADEALQNAFDFTAIITSNANVTLYAKWEQLTQLPEDVTKLFLEKGNTSSNKVFLYCQGGPTTQLRTAALEEFGLSSYHNVYVHQTNTYNQDLIEGLNENLRFERAIQEDILSAEILYRVAKYFKDMGKEVYIVSHSFGSFIVPLFIATKDIDIKKHLIMAGRIDMPDIVWKGFRDRKGYTFAEGITPTLTPLPTNSDKMRKEFYASGRLQAGLGMYRYSELLRTKDLSTVIYAYCTKDQAVGSLTKEEHDFLNSKGATLYVIEVGDHSAMFDSPHKEKLKELLLQ